MDFAKEMEIAVKLALEVLKGELSGIRTNRPSPKLVEDVKVEYMEQQFTLKQLGSISIVPPREIDVSVWDKEALAPVVKAIETSGLGLTANTQGTLIRIFLPAMTDERRQELTKFVKGLIEQTKIRIRNLREEANKKVEAAFKSKVLSEDQKFKSREQVQKVTDKANADAEMLLASKIKEIND